MVGVSPAGVPPAGLVELLYGHATKSVRLALACFKRWEELEESGSTAGVDNLRALCEAGGAGATVAVMAAHARTSAALAERGCRALATIAHRDHANKERVTVAGGAGAVADAMSVHSQTTAVVIQALVGLANLAAGDEACKTAIIAACAPAACASVMVAHPSDETVQLQGLRLLANLTTSAPAIRDVLTSGGVAASVLAMAEHWSDPGLMWLAARVLANVAENAEGVHAVCDAGGATAIVCALETHSDEDEVLSDGCRALANLAFSPGAKDGENDAPDWREVGRAAADEALAEQKKDAVAPRVERIRQRATSAYAARGGAAGRRSRRVSVPAARTSVVDAERRLGWLKQHASGILPMDSVKRVSIATPSVSMAIGAKVSAELGGEAPSASPSVEEPQSSAPRTLSQRVLIRAASGLPAVLPTAPTAPPSDLTKRLSRRASSTRVLEMVDWPAPPPTMLPRLSSSHVAEPTDVSDALGGEGSEREEALASISDEEDEPSADAAAVDAIASVSDDETGQGGDEVGAANEETEQEGDAAGAALGFITAPISMLRSSMRSSVSWVSDVASNLVSTAPAVDEAAAPASEQPSAPARRRSSWFGASSSAPASAPPSAPAAAAPAGGAGEGEVIDLDTIGFMALKRLVIANGVPKKEASDTPTKGGLKELAIKHGANLTFA